MERQAYLARVYEVEVLRMIDPALVEHKTPIVLCVIS